LLSPVRFEILKERLMRRISLVPLAQRSTLLLCSFLLNPVLAQTDYPSKPITMVVPFPPAGSTDVLGRILAVAMSKHLQQPVNVENTGGAGGTIGAARVSRSAPDGYSVLFHNMAHSSAQALYAKLSYDPISDFEPIGLVTDVPMILVARKDFPSDSLAGLIAYAKANPGKVNFSNAGVGATSHLCELLLGSVTGSKWTSVPYKGTGPALIDLLGGQVDLICDQPASTLGHIRSGKLKPIAVASKVRVGAVPEVPTFAEAGLQGFELAVWHGMYVAKGTPKPVVDKLAAALRVALKDPVLVQRFQEMSSQIYPPEQVNPEALRSFLRSEVNRWKTTLKNAGVQPE
jgi:tripartite-type tricarboxylate transporter receptor subunit TctC